jgi:hypothetical protein
MSVTFSCRAMIAKSDSNFEVFFDNQNFLIKLRSIFEIVVLKYICGY